VTVELADDTGARRAVAATRSGDEVLRLDVTIRVERESQKGMVIGRRGAVLKEALTNARRELEALLGTRVFMQTRVRVDRDWQRRPQALDRLGFRDR
jgi:GTP-binding protein Era